MPRPILPAQLTTSGFAGGAGRAGLSSSAALQTQHPHLPSDITSIEKRLGRMGLADFRGVMQYDAQRGAVRFQVNPVFASSAEVQLPPLSLLPGAEKRRKD